MHYPMEKLSLNNCAASFLLPFYILLQRIDCLDLSE